MINLSRIENIQNGGIDLSKARFKNKPRDPGLGYSEENLPGIETMTGLGPDGNPKYDKTPYNTKQLEENAEQTKLAVKLGQGSEDDTKRAESEAAWSKRESSKK